ncbi:MAG: phosphoglycerate kinase, partial [bacterium]|nr:phosphoglycerate kinase [bacterium]
MAAELAEGFDVYVNEAFGTSHRKHTSIDALPRWMKKQGRDVNCGPRFAKEVATLTNILTQSGQKVLVIGGSKVADKEKYAKLLESKFDQVLRGGLLPGIDLRPDGLDISDATIASYQEKLSLAGVIVAAGVMGKFEDANAEKGTKEILTSITSSGAYKVAGGGDIEAAIAKYGLTNKFDWISVGGGAMLEYLATGTLPGIEALVS